MDDLRDLLEQDVPSFGDGEEVFVLRVVERAERVTEGVDSELFQLDLEDVQE